MADPWTVTSYTDAEFDFEGQHYVMHPNDTYSTDDACQMKAFIAAWHQATNGGVFNERPGALQDLDQACPPGSAPADSGPPVPPSNTNPSAGVDDSPPPGGDETPQTLSTPAPSTNATVDSTPRASGE